jgi:inner membrane protein
MPSPIGHSLMGYLAYRTTAKATTVHQWRLVLLYVFAANAPDLDFLPGILLGDVSRFHHGPSHSIAAAAVFGVLSAAFFSQKIQAFLIAFSLYLSHVLLDYLVRDPSPPFGVPIFWPLNNEYEMAPFAFFYPIRYPTSFSTPLIPIVFNLHNLFTVITEVLFLLPALAFVSWRKKLSQGSTLFTGCRCERSAEE